MLEIFYYEPQSNRSKVTLDGEAELFFVHLSKMSVRRDSSPSIANQSFEFIILEDYFVISSPCLINIHDLIFCYRYSIFLGVNQNIQYFFMSWGQCQQLLGHFVSPGLDSIAQKVIGKCLKLISTYNLFAFTLQAGILIPTETELIALHITVQQLFIVQFTRFTK